MNSFLSIQQTAYLSPLVTILIVCFLFVIKTLVQYQVFKKTGRFSGNYPPNTFLLFAPIYEEILFRGVVLAGLIIIYGQTYAIIISSVLFGLWHIRSIFFMSYKRTFLQVVYTGMILGPIFATVTILTGSVWIAVMLHYLNNIFAPILEPKNKQ